MPDEAGVSIAVALGESAGPGKVAVGAGLGIAVGGAAQEETRITARRRIDCFMNLPLIDFGCWQKLYVTTS
jgi:hypothetical protein